MGQINYSFDPTKGRYEIKDLFDLLHRFYPEIPDDPYNYNKQNSANNLEKDREIQELNGIIEKQKNETENKNKEIESLKEKLKDAEESSKMRSEEVEELQNQIKKINEESTAKEDKLQTDFKNEIDKLKEEKEREIASLNKQLENYKMKLALYEPTMNGDTGSDIFFNIEGCNLLHTNSSDAPFIGKVDVEGKAIFTFNVERGQHKYYVQNVSELKDYCDIIESVEGANHIGLGEWGKGQFHNGLLIVTTKAKIKLVKE